MALDLEHLRLQAQVALKHPELSGWADAVLELIHELATLRAENERLTHAGKKALWILQNWDQYKQCICRDLAEDRRHCERHIAERLLREALSTPQAKDAFADLPSIGPVSIPTIGTLGPDGKVAWHKNPHAEATEQNLGDQT